MTNKEVDVGPSAKAALETHQGQPFPKGLAKLLADRKISDERLHQYCLYALSQCIEHGNTGFAIKLLEMLGKRHPTKRKIAWWFCTFGNFGINKEGRLVYRKRRSIIKEDIKECVAKASAVPFYSDKLGTVKIAKLSTTPVISKKISISREHGGESSSVWAVSGGLPSLGKRR